MLDALLIRKEWLDRILAGKKIWEIRGSRTQKRGLIALVQSQSGTVVGSAELVDCLGPLTLDELNANMDKVGDTELWDDAGYDRPQDLQQPLLALGLGQAGVAALPVVEHVCTLVHHEVGEPIGLGEVLERHVAGRFARGREAPG